MTKKVALVVGLSAQEIKLPLMKEEARKLASWVDSQDKLLVLGYHITDISYNGFFLASTNPYTPEIIDAMDNFREATGQEPEIYYIPT